MTDSTNEKKFPNTKTVYGPVKSWRFGMSLGIDPIFEISTCSFNCIYCQLGEIQDVTNLVKEYVPTKKVLEDFKEVIEKEIPIDVVTYSGSGEPSLAKNLGDMINGIRAIKPELPQYILTNATHLIEPEVRKNLLALDKIIVKIDASNEENFKLINRPAEGVTLKRVLEGIKLLKSEFKGEIEVQSMFMPINDKHLEDLASILKEISPSAVQLNTPKRPYPLSWHRENRGNHELVFDYEVRELKKVDENRAVEIQKQLEEKTGLKIYSVYR
ncbi:MAG: radical SAM protein [Halobacteriovorax sp.]|nr:radical SAM protein [Halobacteriovorax sp.]|tara:strand:- start:83770 stop:84582 length:813 start_codon:yes stop_codon:yes gene_type:complete